jgi:hypothetical protein
LQNFGALAGMQGVNFVSLQKDGPAAQLRHPPAGLVVNDWTGELGDFADTAALIEALDLVISVDTPSAIWPARSASLSGSSTAMPPAGAGCSIGRTALGTRALCYSVNRSRAIGPACSPRSAVRSRRRPVGRQRPSASPAASRSAASRASACPAPRRLALRGRRLRRRCNGFGLANMIDQAPRRGHSQTF